MNTCSPEIQAEFTLTEIAKHFWNDKRLIFVTVFIFCLSGFGIATSLTHTYIISLKINDLPPETHAKLKSLDLYNDTFPTPPITEFINTLLNQSVRESFILSQNSQSHSNLEKHSNANARLKEFNDNFIITSATNNIDAGYIVSMKTSQPEATSKELQDFISHSQNHLNEVYTSRYIAIKSQTIGSLENKLLQKNKILINKRLNRIKRLEEEQQLNLREAQAQLLTEINIAQHLHNDLILNIEEAIKIAEVLDIQKPSALRDLSPKERSNFAVEFVNHREPLYLRGSNLLSAELEQLRTNPDGYTPTPKIRKLQARLEQLKLNNEIEILKARKNDLPFYPELNTIQEQILLLTSQHYSEVNLNFANSHIQGTDTPVSPNKPLIIGISTLAGLMLSLLFSLTRLFSKGRA